MTENGKRVYDFLMTGPEWFDMKKHATCILGVAAHIEPRLVPRIPDSDLSMIATSRNASIVTSGDAFEWFGLPIEILMKLCLSSTNMLLVGSSGAIEAAKLLKQAYEKEQAGDESRL